MFSTSKSLAHYNHRATLATKRSNRNQRESKESKETCDENCTAKLILEDPVKHTDPIIADDHEQLVSEDNINISTKEGNEEYSLCDNDNLNHSKNDDSQVKEPLDNGHLDLVMNEEIEAHKLVDVDTAAIDDLGEQPIEGPPCDSRDRIAQLEDEKKALENEIHFLRERYDYCRRALVCIWTILTENRTDGLEIENPVP